MYAAIEDARVYFDDHDVAGMTLDEFDLFFDAHGQPRAGVKFGVTRGIPLDSSTDPASQREARRRS
jgi:hypothetical protein